MTFLDISHRQHLKREGSGLCKIKDRIFQEIPSPPLPAKLFALSDRFTRGPTDD